MMFKPLEQSTPLRDQTDADRRQGRPEGTTGCAGTSMDRGEQLEAQQQVLRIAQGRGNQENLIKDFKYGLGLAHIPTDRWRRIKPTS